MNIYLLLELIILIFLISLVITRDIFSPACVMCETYILATVSAIFNIDKWNINLHNNTVKTILFGITKLNRKTIALAGAAKTVASRAALVSHSRNMNKDEMSSIKTIL